MRPKMLTLAAALLLGAAALTVAPSASAQVAFRGTFPLPHGVISVGVGDPYYYNPGYTYYAPDYYVSPYPAYTYDPGYYTGYYPSYYPRYYARPHRYYRSYRPYVRHYRHERYERYRSHRRW